MIMSPKQKKKSRQVSTTAGVIIILAFSALLVIIALLSPGMLSLGPSELTVEVPVIITQLTSGDDGGEYTVQTQFAVKIDKSARSKVSSKLLEDTLTTIMSDMDIDAISEPDGVEYLSQRATEQLNNYLSDYTETKVYVTGLLVGDRYVLEDTSSKKEDVMKALFPNME